MQLPFGRFSSSGLARVGIQNFRDPGITERGKKVLRELFEHRFLRMRKFKRKASLEIAV